MGKKLGLTSLLFRTRDTTSSPPWPWLSCNIPKTHSFRAAGGGDHEACEAASSSAAAESESFSTASEGSREAIVRGLRSDRLFFDPGGGTSSKVEAAAKDGVVPLAGSLAVEMESEEPYRDFRVSMEEVVVAHGVMDWDWMEEMLGWYLRVNGKRLHGIIVGAFADLLLELASSPSAFSSSSSSSSSFFCSTFEIEDVKEEEGSG